MIPAAFVWLETFPLTPNGKIDRNALPAPNAVRPILAAACVLPQTQIEETLAGIWRQILRIDVVGVQDSFFDLGGNSLLVLQTHLRICSALKVDFPVMRFFEHPTIAALAGFLASCQKPSLPDVQERAARQRNAFTRRKVQAVAA